MGAQLRQSHKAVGNYVTCSLLQYNYLVDARTRTGMKNVQWRNSILIFDEAHNVEVCLPSTAD